MLGELPSNVPLPGELFAEKYRIERVLGKGGMGVVFAATHIHLHQRFAVKLLLPAAALDPDTVQRFLREGRAAVKIRSEHVARVIDVGGLADGTPYLVMEYLEGVDFAELLEGEQRLPCLQAVDYVLQACEAVAEAHSLKIVHRDLKPSNLFLAEQPDGKSVVKVLDFGISKMLEPGLDMTSTMAMMGSPLYMSPEQLKSARDVDARADLWSIGVILYQLVAGRPPFVADSLPELCAVVLSSPPRWLHRDAPDVPEGLARVIATCLRSQRGERFVNLADLADALAPFGSAAARGSADRIVALLGLPETRAALVPLPAFDPMLADTRNERAVETTRGIGAANRGERRLRRWLAPAAAVLVIAGVSAALALRSPPSGASEPARAPTALVDVPRAAATAAPPASAPSAAPVASAEPAPSAAPVKVRSTLLDARRPSPAPPAPPAPSATTATTAPERAAADVPPPPPARPPIVAGVATSSKD